MKLLNQKRNLLDQKYDAKNVSVNRSFQTFGIKSFVLNFCIQINLNEMFKVSQLVLGKLFSAHFILLNVLMRYISLVGYSN